MGFGAAATFFKIRLPNALPAIFGGLKISITLAVVGAVVGEFVGGDAGLGYLLMVANGSMDTQLLFAGIVALTILGVVLVRAGRAGGAACHSAPHHLRRQGRPRGDVKLPSLGPRQPQHRFDHGRGSATPLPAMSCALPCATEANRIGVPMVSAAAAFWRQKLRGDVALVVQHDDEGVDAPHVKHRIGAERAGRLDAARGHRVDRRFDDLDLLASEQSALAGMRIEAADGDLGLPARPAFERAVGGCDHPRHPLARDHLDRLPHALVQRGVDDLHVAEAEHQIDVVRVGAVSRATNDGWPSNSMPASAMDVSFCGAATTASTSPASAALIARPAKAMEARPLTALVAPKSSVAASGCAQSSTFSRCARPIRVGDLGDHVQVERDAAGLGVPLDHAWIAHHDRIAGVAHLAIERGLEADLRSDARRIARGDGDDCYCHGISDAWITSGTPWPPTDRMARSTSFSPKRWVVTFSSGKRFEASCSSASSQAL